MHNLTLLDAISVGLRSMAKLPRQNAPAGNGFLPLTATLSGAVLNMALSSMLGTAPRIRDKYQTDKAERQRTAVC